MSKIANRVILIPQKVKINLGVGTISAEGPLGKGEELIIPANLEIINQENNLITKSTNYALAGTYNALISNMIKGVVEGHESIVEVKGVGYKVFSKEGKLEFFLGKSHPDYVVIPPELEVKVTGNKITIKGKDKQKVTNLAAAIRCLRLPNIYKKDKGIYYLGEAKTIKLKAGKSTLIKGSLERPRVVLSESNRYLRVQAIDDTVGNTLLYSSTEDFLEGNNNFSRKNKDYAKKLGELFADKLKKEGKEKIVFDRNGRPYHGKIVENYSAPGTEKNNSGEVKLAAAEEKKNSVSKESGKEWGNGRRSPRSYLKSEVLANKRVVKVTKGGRRFSFTSLVLVKDEEKKAVAFAHSGGKEVIVAFRSGIKASGALSRLFKFLEIKDVSAKIIGSRRNKLNKKKIVGRGIGSGRGKTSGRGQKGQGSRKSGHVRPGFEGGQTPVYRAFPKRGGGFKKKTPQRVVNLENLEKDERVVAGQVMDFSQEKLPVKVLGEGNFTKNLTIKAAAFSRQAKEKITQAGGAKKISFPNQWMPLTDKGKAPAKGNLFFSGQTEKVKVLNKSNSDFFKFVSAWPHEILTKCQQSQRCVNIGVDLFDFRSGEKESFFDLGRARKKELREKNITSLEGDKILKLVDVNYNQEVKEFIQHNPNSKLLLVNYPHNEQQFTSLSSELAKEGKKINNIILLNISNYELILKIKDQYLICPLCEKIYQKEETIKENEKFVCPQDSEYQFSPEDIRKFSEYVIEYHLKNTELIIKKFLSENKLTTSSIIQLTIQKKEEIFTGETQKNLLKVIENSSKYINNFSEYQKALQFLEDGCDCGCYSVLPKEKFAKLRADFQSLSKPEQDAFVMANLISMGEGETTTSISLKYFESIKSHLLDKGLSTRVHGNTGKIPIRKTKMVIDENIKEKIKEFILSYAKTHGLPNPGRSKGTDNIAIFLPTEMSYKSQLTPQIGFMSPRSDLCDTCHKFRARLERDYYNQNTRLVGEQKDNAIAHYSFDWSQNIQVPHFDQQPSQMYFLTAHKVHLFGIQNEANGEQITTFFIFFTFIKNLINPEANPLKNNEKTTVSTTNKLKPELSLGLTP
ncbi:7339_t:CDS:10 [Scutellospora calospora]|uniref:7339_t:CDS:1 n=1 Tax=Scutellospora calospora TaxID=85575 RepID=A0ACA9K480_9GLOM|nr:7339_t:CDS:10 [Scutellospora calospora]